VVPAQSRRISLNVEDRLLHSSSLSLLSSSPPPYIHSIPGCHDRLLYTHGHMVLRKCIHNAYMGMWSQLYKRIVCFTPKWYACHGVTCFSYAASSCAQYCVMENGDCVLQPSNWHHFCITLTQWCDADITHMNNALQSFSVLLFVYCLFVCDNHSVPTATSADTCQTIQKLRPLCKFYSFTKYCNCGV